MSIKIFIVFHIEKVLENIKPPSCIYKTSSCVDLVTEVQPQYIYNTCIDMYWKHHNQETFIYSHPMQKVEK